jgi:hypothetical protein
VQGGGASTLSLFRGDLIGKIVRVAGSYVVALQKRYVIDEELESAVEVQAIFEENVQLMDAA